MKTRITMKYLIYSCLAACMLSLAACEGNPDIVDDESELLPTSLREVNELIKKAGKIRTLEEKRTFETGAIEKSETAEEYEDPRSGSKQKCYSVKTTKRYSVTENPHEFVTLDPWAHIFPGALIQGASLREGIPATIPIFTKRQPGRIYLSMVSGNKDMDDWFREVTMRASDVTQAMNHLLEKHLDANPARTSFEIKKVSSVEEMALKLGINLNLYGGKLKTEFANGWKKNKNYVAVKLNQIFYTMAYDGPDGGYAGTFTDDITVRDLETFTDTDNPICYVSSVSYGRSFILLYESSETSQLLEFALNAAYNPPVWGLETNLKNRVDKVVKETSCKLVQIGGNPKDGLETVFGDPAKLKKFIVDGALVSEDNIGAPISYKINHLIDNSLVRLSNTSEYSVTEQNFVPAIPNNDVIIDVFNATLSLVPERKQTISNNSRFELKRLEVGVKKLNNNEFSPKKITLEDKEVQSKNGADIPIYRSVVLSKVDKADYIRIECDFRVKNELYRGTRDTAEETIKLTQEFRYEENNNAWVPVENTETKAKNRDTRFYELNFNKKIGRADTHFKLNYRFECDGQEYPIQAW